MVTFILLALLGQDAPPGAEDVLKKHQEALKKIDGVVQVAVGGTADDKRILVRVASDEAKEAVRKAIGETLDGYKVHVYVSKPVGTTAVDPKPADPVGKETTRTPPPATLEDCDIMRDHLKLKAVTHHKDGKTIENCKLMRRQRVGGGGGHTFWYTRHRIDCPIRTGKLSMPEKPDDFLKWVFTQGFSPAEEGSFLGPYGLKGSDRLWFEQVKDDLTSLLPFIREGAKWVKLKEEKAGVGWKWEVRP